MILRSLLRALCALPLTGPTLAGGDITILVEEGQSLPGLGTIYDDPFQATVNDSGSWAVYWQNNVGAELVLVDGAVYAYDLGPIGSTTFLSVGNRMTMGDAGELIWLVRIPGGPGLFVGQQYLVGRGDPIGMPQFPPGATYGNCLDAKSDGQSRILAIWEVLHPSLPGGATGAFFQHDFDAGGNLVSTALHYQLGDVIPGQLEPISGVVSQFNSIAISSSGDILFTAILPTSGTTMFLNTTPIAQWNTPSPWGHPWTFAEYPTVLLNNAGDRAVGWTIDVGGTSVDALSVNGEPTVREGDVVAVSQPHALEVVRQFDQAIDDLGRVLWWGSWNFPNFGTEALFLDRTVLVQEGGWSIAGPHQIDQVGVVAVADISPNGRWVVFDAVLSNGNRAVCLLDTLGLPENYCTAGSSASGCRTGITALGIPSASATSGFELRALPIEGDKDGLFFYGVNGRQAISWGNGTSYRCVIPPIRRGSLLSGSGTPGACDGFFAHDLNARWCATCPKPGHNPGAGAVVQAQLWYRDPSNTSNRTTSLSGGVEFTVCP